MAGREVMARFDGGAVLLRAVDRTTKVLGQLVACFTDHRDPTRVTHPVAALARQQVYALALGHKDPKDHDALRHDPLVAMLAESTDLGAPGFPDIWLLQHEPHSQNAAQRSIALCMEDPTTVMEWTPCT